MAGTSAFALPASGDGEAPMCDPMGASVAAGLEIPEADGGRMDELPCEALILMAGWRPGAPEYDRNTAAFDDAEAPAPQQFQLTRSRYEGACDFSVVFPSRGEPVLSCEPIDDGLAAQPGHLRGVYRPPVARA